MLNAIQMGVFTESTKQRLEELEQQKKNLEEQIAEVSFKKPMLKPESIRNWLYRLRTLNPEKLEHRRVLVNTFVNKIFLYDDKIIFTFNYKSDSKEVTLKGIEVSDIFSGREPTRRAGRKTCSSCFVSELYSQSITHVITMELVMEAAAAD